MEIFYKSLAFKPKFIPYFVKPILSLVHNDLENILVFTSTLNMTGYSKWINQDDGFITKQPNYTMYQFLPQMNHKID